MPSVHAMCQQSRNFLRPIRGKREPVSNAAQEYRDLVLARDYLRLRTSIWRILITPNPA